MAQHRSRSSTPCSRPAAATCTSASATRRSCASAASSCAMRDEPVDPRGDGGAPLRDREPGADRRPSPRRSISTSPTPTATRPASARTTSTRRPASPRSSAPSRPRCSRSRTCKLPAVLRKLADRRSRPRPGDRAHRLGQVDHARGDDRPHQQDARVPRPHHRGSGRVRAPAAEGAGHPPRDRPPRVDATPHAIRSAGREDPNVILIGELRTNETMKLALQLASFGILVFAHRAHQQRRRHHRPHRQRLPGRRAAAGARHARREPGRHRRAAAPSRRPTASGASRCTRSSSARRRWRR